ncbi:MAG: hypothetical protein FJZ67_01870 [Bacteroidetes bacterium]|nr:hypothetical protein [Bacteroidota bacterium]
MKNISFLLLCAMTAGNSFAQKEVNVTAPIKKATIFFTGAQIEHVEIFESPLKLFND